MIRLRELPDGTLLAPRRGKPPTCPDGYLPMHGNPFIFEKILKDCSFRTIKLVKTKCCKDKTVIHCAKFDKNVIRKDCILCELQ